MGVQKHSVLFNPNHPLGDSIPDALDTHNGAPD